MSLLSAMDTSASGLMAEKRRMELIAQNVANIETTRTTEGGPYKRKAAVFREVLDNQLSGNAGDKFNGAGVEVAEVITDEKEPLRVYDPQHPDADQDGYVLKPNINLADEIVDSITASRAYSANVTVLNTTKEMAVKALSIGRG